MNKVSSSLQPLHKNLFNHFFFTGVTAFDSLVLDLFLYCVADNTIVSEQQQPPFFGIMYRQVVYQSQYVYVLSRVQGFRCAITIIRYFQDLARRKHAYLVYCWEQPCFYQRAGLGVPQLPVLTSTSMAVVCFAFGFYHCWLLCWFWLLHSS